jgi:hypothetical protein
MNAAAEVRAGRGKRAVVLAVAIDEHHRLFARLIPSVGLTFADDDGHRLIRGEIEC